MKTFEKVGEQIVVTEEVTKKEVYSIDELNARKTQLQEQLNSVDNMISEYNKKE